MSLKMSPTNEQPEFARVLRQMSGAMSELVDELTSAEPDVCEAHDAGRLTDEEHELAHDLVESATGLEFVAKIIEATTAKDGTLQVAEPFVREICRMATHVFDSSRALVERLHKA